MREVETLIWPPLNHLCDQFLKLIGVWLLDHWKLSPMAKIASFPLDSAMLSRYGRTEVFGLKQITPSLRYR
jgi:hypothetical protein